MTNSTKKTTNRMKRTANNVNSKGVKQPRKMSWEETFDAHKLLAVPLLALAAYCIYITILTSSINSLAQVFQMPFALLMFPPFPAIFVGVFCCLASYMLLKERPIGRLVTIAGWLFTLVSLWLVLAWLATIFPGSNPPKCEGLFGVMENCADTGYFQAYVLLLNPFSLGAYSLISVIGIIRMAIQLKKRKIISER